ncbi:MAG: F0F1 ATP synthase subunit alpha, partial [Anaerolineales bacterium]
MSDFAKELTASLQQQISAFQPMVVPQDVGTVLEAGDGIARAQGLGEVQAQELVQFDNGIMGIAFNLERESVGIIIMGDYGGIEQGMGVRGTGRIASVPVGDAMIGRVVNALGQPIDGRGPIATTKFRPIERIAPGVIERK